MDHLRAQGHRRNRYLDDKKIAAIRDLQEHTAGYVSAVLPKIYTHELVNVIFALPYCRIAGLPI